MNIILFNLVLLMIELDYLALMEALLELGYIVYLKSMNDSYLMMNLRKLCG